MTDGVRDGWREAFERPGWPELGNCVRVDAALMFPGRGEDTVPGQLVCSGETKHTQCPVQAQCLAFALLEIQKHGIWGGTSERGRRAIRRAVSRGQQAKVHDPAAAQCLCVDCLVAAQRAATRSAAADAGRRRSAGGVGA